MNVNWAKDLHFATAKCLDCYKLRARSLGHLSTVFTNTYKTAREFGGRHSGKKTFAGGANCADCKKLNARSFGRLNTVNSTTYKTARMFGGRHTGKKTWEVSHDQV